MGFLQSLLLWVFTLTTINCQTQFMVGRGRADMTGIASEGALYGYAKPDQDARGIHMRQYARAFIFEYGPNRVCLVVSDSLLISQALHKEVVERLQVIYGDQYTEENVMLSPTHSHATPGGTNSYYMYYVPTGGFINETFQAYAGGIVQAIQIAHDDLQPGNVYLNSGDLLDASVNRSPWSYDQNPPEEIARYSYNTDKEMTVLKIVDSADGDLGMINFFPVHTTSMKNYNHLISTDNKGYATQMFERNMTQGMYPTQTSFVAAFAQSAEGDASPNTDGERCNGTNDYCSYNTSTCPEDLDNPSLCTGRGPAGEQFEDVKIIGEKQYLMGKALYDNATIMMAGAVDYRFMWVNMTEVVADLGSGQTGELCQTSMGYSFAAGASDGPGIPPFTQGMLEGIPDLDELIENVWGIPDSLAACQVPKPILLPTSVIGSNVNSTTDTWMWQPQVVPLQLIRIGDVVYIGVPAEVTTMAGRRLSDAVKNALVTNGYPASTRCVVAAMTNLYSSYIVTYQEYQVQRYEGASTIYGQYTLDGYITKFVEMAGAMARGDPVDIGIEPPDLRGFTEESLAPIVRDATDVGVSYGDILVDAQDTYQTGETAFATFVAGNPRNDVMTDQTFLEVQRQLPDTSWVVEYTDVHWETKFIWLSNCQDQLRICLFPNITGCEPVNTTDRCRREQLSNATIEWDIPAGQQPGTYRLMHYGNARLTDNIVVPYNGVSRSFQVTTVSSNVRRRHSNEYYIATGDGSVEEETNLLRFMDMYFGAEGVALF